ncbi:MAG: hypothetical protein ACUVQH_12460 [Thermogutta sp.]
MTTRAVLRQLTLTIVVIGDNRHTQWNSIWSACDPADRLFSGPTLKTVKELVKSGIYPDLLILFEDHVKQFAERDWLFFHGSSPLTRAIVVYGDWCESEPRTGSPLPGVTRVHWLRWTNCGRDFIASLRRPSASQWHLPLMAAEEERLLADLHLKSSTYAQARFKQIGILTPSRESFAWLEGVTTSSSDSRVWIRQSSEPIRICPPPDLLIIDLWEEPVTAQRMVETIRQGAWRGVAPETPCIVLANFPRWEIVQRLRCLGQVKVLSKPVLLTDLERALGDLSKSP